MHFHAACGRPHGGQAIRVQRSIRECRGKSHCARVNISTVRNIYTRHRGNTKRFWWMQTKRGWRPCNPKHTAQRYSWPWRNVIVHISHRIAVKITLLNCTFSNKIFLFHSHIICYNYTGRKIISIAIIVIIIFANIVIFKRKWVLSIMMQGLIMYTCHFAPH